MKYLKSFNEELDPSTYRSAAHKLNYYNKTTRSSKIFDYADEKEHGFYNMTFGNNEPSLVVNQKFTSPSLSGISYGKSDVNLLGYKVDGENESELLIDGWAEGSSPLSIKFEFSFRPTREAFSKSNYGIRSDYPTSISTFSIELYMSEWHDGIEEWDAESKWQSELDGEEFKPSDISFFYEHTKSFSLYLISPLKSPSNYQYYGIFSDKKSAVKFKNWLLEKLNNDVVKDSIMNILRTVNANSSDLEEIEKKFKDIKIVGLYDDEDISRQLFTGGKKPSNRWFDKELS